jgi:hypothetical protein
MIIPYAFFSSFGFQERYLYLSSFAFSGLIASLIWELKKKLNLELQVVFVVVFCLIWASLSLNLISQRSRQWLMADEIVKNTQKELTQYCPALNPESQGYLINFPRFIGDQVFIFNNGLGNMLRFSCTKEIGRFDEIFENPQLSSFLKNSENIPEPIPDLFVFAYEDGEVKDYSNKYKYLEDFLHSQVTLADLKSIFSQPQDWFITKTFSKNQLKIRKKDETMVLEYYVFPNGSVSIYHKNVPVILGTQGLSVDIFGDSQGEILYFDLFDKETGEYFRFSQKIEWQDWKTLQTPYSSSQLIGKTISLEDVDDLKISLDGAKEIRGQIRLKNFQEY